MLRALLLSLFLVPWAAARPPQDVESHRGPDRLDPESTRLLRRYTTDPSFLTPWVDHVPESATVPSPRDHLGRVIGTPGELTGPEEIAGYFRALEAASDRLRLFSLGRSHGGREMVVAAIADASILARLDAIRAANARLADPRRTSREEAAELARSTPPTYYVTAGLHSPETGPPEMVMELAYRLVVSEQEHVREIRGGVLTLITPVLEMDGRARMVDWYYRHLTEVEDLQESPPRSPPYWGDYTYHDNNRDGLQVSQPLTRNYVEAFHRWHPTVSLDLHESVPLLYVSTGTGPYNETIDPIAVTEWQWLASYDVGQATRLGLRGVWSWGFYTGWYPGYLLWVTNTHNALGRFYETFGNSHPGTFVRDLRRSSYAGSRVNAREWYRAWPPEQELEWSLRNNTNYMQTGVLASLQLAARNGETLLLGYWQKGLNSLERGRREPPHAFHVPAGQDDRGALHHLLWLLHQHRVEVHRASAAVELAGRDAVPAGDFVVRLDQPYGNFARTLLGRQRFPSTAEHPPYDDVSWSLPLMLGLEVHAVDDPAVLAARLERVGDVPALPGDVGEGRRWVVPHRGQAALASLGWALADVGVRALAEEWEDLPAGSLVIEGIDRRRAEELAAELHLEFRSLERGADPPTVAVELPRVALFHTWRYTQDSGWARYALEELGVPYALIDKDDLRAGELGSRFDVILVPNTGRSGLADLVQGIDRRWSPLAYTTTAEYPSHGRIDSSPDITGGMGFEGLGNLQRFVEGGGLLVLLGNAGVLAADSGIARDVSTEAPAGTPGSHVTATVLRPEHPVAWGYPRTTHVFHGNLRGYSVPERLRGRVLVQYGTRTRAEEERRADERAGVSPPAGGGEPGTGDGERSARPPLCLSGLVSDPDALERRPALIDVPAGEGRVLLFSWNPLHRFQNHHDFGFLTNALLFHDHFPAPLSEDEVRAREAGR